MFAPGPATLPGPWHRHIQPVQSLEPEVKPRPPQRRKPPARDALPPDVPEVVSEALPVTEDENDPIPEHIRRMLEAAYT
jgi:hypothetical protein